MRRKNYARIAKLKAALQKEDVFDETTEHALREVNGDVVELKYCPACGKWRPLADFHKDKYRPDKLKCHCISCVGKERKMKKETSSSSTHDCKRVRDLKATLLPGDKFDNKTRHILRIINGEIKELKFCSKHKKWEPVENFGKKTKAYDGLQPCCRAKRNSIYRSRYQKVRPEGKMHKEVKPNLVDKGRSGAHIKDFEKLTDNEIQELLGKNTIPVRILFETIIKQTGDKYVFYAFDKELGMSFPIKAQDEPLDYTFPGK